jgi:perosamine synthetase
MTNTNRFIPVAKPWMDERDIDAVRRPILSGWVTQGPEVEAFEKEFAAYVGAPYASAVSSCTTALFLALMAVGVGAGDEVITVSHSFIATANSVRYCGAIPVFVDILPDTYTMNPALIEAAISDKTKAILCVHQIGMPCDMSRILEIARKHRIPVVEDAACAIGSEILWDGKWEKVGKPHGEIACFSFHPRKLLTTGDGGMITTANAEIDQKIKRWRQHGMSIRDTVRHSSKTVLFESFTELGYNFRLTDIQAAIGREQLRRLPEVLARRKEQVDRYFSLLANIPGLTLPSQPEWARTNWQSFCLLLAENLNQREVMQSMLDDEIATRSGVMCAHREKAYEKGAWLCCRRESPCQCPPGACKELAVSEMVQDRGMILPLFHQLTEDEQIRVAESLAAACKKQVN